MQLFSRRPVSVLGAFAIAFSLIAPLAGAAQDDPNSDSAADGVGVARINFIEGSVAVQRGDADESFTAALNTPVLGGDYVSTGAESRAEIQLDGNAQLRLGWNTQMRFNHLDDSNRTIQLASGTLGVHLLRGTNAANVVDTPSIEVKPQTAGTFRISVTPDGKTLVTVRSGSAQIDTPQGVQTLQPGTTLVAQGDPASPSIQTGGAIAFDSFDHFNSDRDRVDAPALADAGFVNADIGGVEDLDAYGRWVNDGSYGHVWVPASVGPNWAPYRNGRWVWEAGYGWTWVASEPWGWAPYHYGSWYNSPNYGWCWYPPRPRVYVPWRPALVAFIGFGGGSGFSLGFGGGNAIGQIGWVPLAPSEPYHPWWGNGYGARGGTVVNNVTRINNVTNVTNITNTTVYKNLRYNGASSVSSQRFLQGDFAHNTPVTAPQLRGAQAFHGALPVVPTASNLRFTAAAATPSVAVRPALMERSFAGHAVAVRRTPFTTERVSLAIATRAAVTPLHFKDAQSTPLVPDRKLVHVAPQAVGPNVAPAHPNAPVVHAPAAGKAYATPAEPNAYHAPAAPAPHTAPGAVDSNHAPVDSNHAPVDSNHAPVNTSHATPINGNPAPAGSYHGAPASSPAHPPVHPAPTIQLEDAHASHASHVTGVPAEPHAAPPPHTKTEKHEANPHDGQQQHAR